MGEVGVVKTWCPSQYSVPVKRCQDPGNSQERKLLTGAGLTCSGSIIVMLESVVVTRQASVL